MVEWRSIPSNPKYLVSDDGQVRHVNSARPRKLSKAPNGYFFVGFWQDRKLRVRTVHSLVAEAFIGPRPEGADTRHLDGDRANNHVENIAYGTKRENMADRERHGRTRRGQDNGNARLSNADVDMIRLVYAKRLFSQDQLAVMFGTSQAQVHNIVRFKQRRAA